VEVIDCNGIQADGPVVLDMEPVADKWRAFGWQTAEIDGNDMTAVVGALADARNRNGKPKAIILRTRPGKGVPRIETSEKSHFFRINVAQWDGIIAEFEKTVGASQ
ncbi:transketolase, partial [Mesorhizobium sp. M8A.F.Ca.ET.059.01.1.1]